MRQGKVLAGMAMLIAACQPFYGSGRAQDAINDLSSAEDVFSEPDREQWLARVAEAKRRAREFALEQRMRSPAPAADLSAEEARLASERVIGDSSLQRGDIVSTSKGLFVFRGQPDQEHRESDFIALPRR
jgi:hypothetical protein